jgi:excinuclease UvrABC nuclease subunit
MHDKPPESISNIQNIKQMPRHGYQPGVYFLCKDNDVIYVGQSVTPSSRIASHTRDSQKKFDRVYLLPVPQSELNDVEAAFIHHLQPVANGGLRSGRKPVAPVMSRPKSEILKSVNFDCGAV